MALGRPRDVNQINFDLSDLADKTRNLFEDWDTLNQALEDLGVNALLGEDKFTQEEIDLLTRIVIDTRLLRDIFNGDATLEQPRDFTFNLRRVWGLKR